MRRVRLFALPLLLLATAWALADSPADRPFQAHVKATWDNIFLALVAPPATFEGTGQVTHLGRAGQAGWLVLQAPNADGLFPGFGSVTMTAANGDTLTFDYEGLLNPLTGEGIGTFIFTGGTGRFANATGGGSFYALIDLSAPTGQSMTVDLAGSISY